MVVEYSNNPALNSKYRPDPKHGCHLPILSELVPGLQAFDPIRTNNAANFLPRGDASLHNTVLGASCPCNLKQDMDVCGFCPLSVGFDRAGWRQNGVVQ